jgi:uncharacterized phage-associated protein
MHAADVAEYILQKLGPMQTMKLQKLVYYCQAWALVWLGRPLFREAIEAWTNGPVIPGLWQAHKGSFRADTVGGDTNSLEKVTVHHIDRVLGYYGRKAAQDLIDLTHFEDPWRLARGDRGANERGNEVITNESMRAYYSQFPEPRV